MNASAIFNDCHRTNPTKLYPSSRMFFMESTSPKSTRHLGCSSRNAPTNQTRHCHLVRSVFSVTASTAPAPAPCRCAGLLFTTNIKQLTVVMQSRRPRLCHYDRRWLDDRHLARGCCRNEKTRDNTSKGTSLVEARLCERRVRGPRWDKDGEDSVLYPRD